MNRKVIKNQAKLILRTNYRKFLKLNFVSILLCIFYYAGINATASYVVYNFEPDELSRQIASGKIFQFSTSQMILILGFELFAVMVKVGVQYTILDYIRGKDVEMKNLLSKTFQVFSTKYFFSIITLWIIGTFFTNYGLAIFIIPGVYLYLIFSQQFLIYKDGIDSNEHFGIISTIYNSAKAIRYHKWDYLLLDLSFIGWDFLNIISCGLISFWLIPYKNISYTIFYSALITNTKGRE